MATNNPKRTLSDKPLSKKSAPKTVKLKEATSKQITVSILNKKYQVSCSPDEVPALKKSAVYLDQRMQEMQANSRVLTLDHLAVMAALNITNDLLTEAETAEKLAAQREKEVAKLAARVDEALQRLKSGA